MLKDRLQLCKDVNIASDYSKLGKMLDLCQGEQREEIKEDTVSGFDEKNVKLILYCIAMNFRFFYTKSEMEVNRHYPDLLMIPRKGMQNILQQIG